MEKKKTINKKTINNKSKKTIKRKPKVIKKTMYDFSDVCDDIGAVCVIPYFISTIIVYIIGMALLCCGCKSSFSALSDMFKTNIWVYICLVLTLVLIEIASRIYVSGISKKQYDGITVGATANLKFMMLYPSLLVGVVITAGAYEITYNLDKILEFIKSSACVLGWIIIVAVLVSIVVGIGYGYVYANKKWFDSVINKEDKQ